MFEGLPKEKWVYYKDKDVICIEEFLHLKDLKIRFDEPILSVSVDKYVAIRTRNEVVLLDKEGNILWKKKVKSNAISQYSDYVAIAKGKKLKIYNANGEEVLSKRIGRKISALNIGKLIIVGSDKGLHTFDYNGNKLWEIDIGKTTLIKHSNFIAAVVKDELILISLEGEVLWRKKFDKIIYDVEFNEVLKVYTYKGKVFSVSYDGKVIDSWDEYCDFRFLPLPWITVKDELEKLKEMLKISKPVKPKDAKKLMKNAEKMFKKQLYGKSYELILKAFEVIREKQFQIIIPKKVSRGKPFEILFKFYNFFDEVLDGVEVDLSDFERYFEISEKEIRFPEIRKGMYIEKKVSANAKYEGLFIVKAVISSNFGVFQKEFKIRVKKPLFTFTFKFREKEEKTSITDLLK